jgi:uncharacterized protein (DUF952 family)
LAVYYHITRKSEWSTALATGLYTADSLATEGFIHCSMAHQLIPTANRLFRGRRDLVVLAIDSSRVGADIRHENLEGGTERFPHIYGALEVGAVVAVHLFPPRADGSFGPPAEL